MVTFSESDVLYNLEAEVSWKAGVGLLNGVDAKSRVDNPVNQNLGQSKSILTHFNKMISHI